ncbi:hypothetical protein NBRC110019_15200 [Neptunitalea chrysea]|uniref:DUF6265 domain-containing protein n=1 Tax=Neptunitalea chrysea TaxID=1647581 RepID=A0A9W6B4N9_9FLAO|nr:DUF6265 family protein [Neptunitalea chrysea]GLB52480.1 hypothetical protein NBRC110019_15200 [Neptunitalea chrysea]
MKTIRYFVYTLVGLLLIISCAKATPSLLNKVTWLKGTWKYNYFERPVFEEWNHTSDTLFTGKSYMINEQEDTLVLESVQLIEKNDRLNCIIIVPTQNNNLPITFVSTTITDTSVIFENPKHDFPQVIAYKKLSADSLQATISGIANNEKREIEFSMKRVK